jgi:hypothetical protein
MGEQTTPIMPETLTASTWLVVPRGFFAREFELVHDGQTVTTLRLALFKEACEFTLGGHEFAARRRSIWKCGFDFSCDGVPICSVKHNFWSWRYEIEAADQTWTLKRAGWFTRSHQLLSGEQEVGTIRPTGFFSSRRAAHFLDSVPPPIQVLAIFMVLILARREQHSAAT